VRDELAADGVAYSFARRSPSHALAVKLGESAHALLRLLARALGGRPRIVHARSYLPGAVAQLAAELVPGARFVFDCRGLLGDEYVDFGHWQRDGLRYRLLKRFERRLFGRAAAVVTLTDRLRRWLRDESLVPSDTPIEVIPCCVNLSHFAVDNATRERARAQLGAGDRFVLAYAGNLGSWYCEREMAHLYAALRRRRPAHFAVFTRAGTERLRAALGEAGVPPSEVSFRAVSFADMPAHLAAADAAVSFARPAFSKIASSPVKVAEYLAVGVPVVMNRGVGDSDTLLGHSAAVIDAGALDAADLERAADELAALSSGALCAEARALARARYCMAEVGVARYRRLYEELAR
jgi:glycosyltransferase involved in cell wall biosynthesis